MGRKKKDQVVICNMSGQPLPPLVYGLKGIQDLFKVSKVTACKMHQGILKDACSKQGNKIVVNTQKALELYGVPNVHVSPVDE